jgi:hypothetical protein
MQCAATVFNGLPHSSEQSHSRACSVVPIFLLAYVHSDSTANVALASAVESGRSR